MKNEELIANYLEGDISAFNVLVRKHQSQLFNFLLKYIGDREAAAPQQELTPEMLEKIQYENYKLTTQLLEFYQARDEKQTAVMFKNLLTEMRKERSREYEELLGTVNHAYRANDIRIQQTSHTVDEIINLLSTGCSK
ncbi:MAG: hypothetical protein ACLFQM_04150 [Fidelibacterota bacterium]